MAIRRDITGLRSGKLTALTPHHTNGRQWFWTVQCDCGTEAVARADKLIAGSIKSCGCTRPWNAGQRKWGHPTGKDRTYTSWAQMIQRCTNPKASKYKYYGGTGITVCDRWRNSFGAFLEDMGARPPGTSIDRWPDPYGNYEPENCRWANTQQQAENKRKYRKKFFRENSIFHFIK